MYVYLVGVTN